MQPKIDRPRQCPICDGLGWYYAQNKADGHFKSQSETCKYCERGIVYSDGVFTSRVRRV